MYKSGKIPPLDPLNPHSYRVIGLADAGVMIFQKGLYNQLLDITLRSNLLTSSQGACRPNCQNFDTIYTLTSYIRHQRLVQNRPTYVFFGDIELAFPSVFRELLLLRLRDLQVPSPLLQHLRALHNNLQYHIHHTFVPPSSFINVVKGLTEGGRLSPLLWGLYISEFHSRSKISKREGLARQSRLLQGPSSRHRLH